MAFRGRGRSDGGGETPDLVGSRLPFLPLAVF